MYRGFIKGRTKERALVRELHLDCGEVQALPQSDNIRPARTAANDSSPAPAATCQGMEDTAGCLFPSNLNLLHVDAARQSVKDKSGIGRASSQEVPEIVVEI